MSFATYRARHDAPDAEGGGGDVGHDGGLGEEWGLTLHSRRGVAEAV